MSGVTQATLFETDPCTRCGAGAAYAFGRCKRCMAEIVREAMEQTCIMCPKPREVGQLCRTCQDFYSGQ